ncbi:hypothetical protein [Spirosoma litoris]
MTLIDELTAWLKTPRYNAGVELYARLSSSSEFLRKLFAKGYDDFNQKKLYKILSEELSSLLKAQAVKVDRYPEELKTDLARGKQLMDIRSAIKERCRSLYEANAIPRDVGLKAEVFRILDIGDELSIIYGKRKFVDTNGYLPEPATHDGDTKDALINRRNTVRTYVSRLQKQFKNATDDQKREKFSARLATFQSELLAIENQLTSDL